MPLLSLLPEPYVRYAAARPWRVPHLAARYLKMRRSRVLSPRSPAKATNGPRVVISLTTLPSRIGRLRPVIHSLVDQDLPADEIVLALPRVSRREQVGYDVPAWLAEHPHVRILPCDTDWGPATKLIPAVTSQTDDRTLVIAVDDDNVYPRDMVSTFLSWHERFPDAALGYRGWSLPASLRWQDTDTLYATSLPAAEQVDVVTGTWGIMVQPRFFDQGLLDYDAYPREAFFVDDIWFNGHLARAGVERWVIPARYPPLPTSASWVNGLCFEENADGTKNNIVIRAFEPYWNCRRQASANATPAAARQESRCTA